MASSAVGCAPAARASSSPAPAHLEALEQHLAADGIDVAAAKQQRAVRRPGCRRNAGDDREQPLAAARVVPIEDRQRGRQDAGALGIAARLRRNGRTAVGERRTRRRAAARSSLERSAARRAVRIAVRLPRQSAARRRSRAPRRHLRVAWRGYDRRRRSAARRRCRRARPTRRTARTPRAAAGARARATQAPRSASSPSARWSSPIFWRTRSSACTRSTPTASSAGRIAPSSTCSATSPPSTSAGRSPTSSCSPARRPLCLHASEPARRCATSTCRCAARTARPRT